MNTLYLKISYTPEQLQVITEFLETKGINVKMPPDGEIIDINLSKLLDKAGLDIETVGLLIHTMSANIKASTPDIATGVFIKKQYYQEDTPEWLHYTPDDTFPDDYTFMPQLLGSAVFSEVKALEMVAKLYDECEYPDFELIAVPVMDAINENEN